MTEIDCESERWLVDEKRIERKMFDDGEMVACDGEMVDVRFEQGGKISFLGMLTLRNFQNSEF